VQPGFRHLQVAMDGGLGNVEGGSGFLIRQSAEKKQLDDLGFAASCISSRWRASSRSARPEPMRDRSGRLHRTRYAGAPSALLAVSGFGVVHQNVSHHARRDRVKVNSILPIATGIGKPQIRLMDESRRAQSMFGALGPHAAGSEFSKLIVNQGNQAIEGSPVASAEPLQQLGYGLRLKPRSALLRIGLSPHVQPRLYTEEVKFCGFKVN